MKLIDMEALKYFYGKLEQIFTGVTVTIEPQTFTEEQKAQARANIGAGSTSFTGDYNDLINKPQVAGQSSINAGKTIKSWSETDGKVSITTQDISIAKSQISDFAHTHTTSDITDLGDMGFATEQYVTNAIGALPSPMVFKGSLGTDGTITELPVAVKANTGFTYKVITDGTYSGQAAKSGDMFISDGSAWIYIPSADESSGTVTSVGVSVPTGLSVDNTPITSSGTIAISMENGYSIPTNTKQGQWDTAYTHSQSTHARTDATNVTASTNGNIKIDGVDTTVYSHPTQKAKTSGMYKITVDGNGHVSGAVTATASDLSYSSADTEFTATTVQGAIDELKNSVSDGKSSIASAITEKGVTTASDATFATMATNIGLIEGTASGTAVASDVVKGKTFCSDAGMDITGTMESYTDDEVKINNPSEESVEDYFRFVCTGQSGKSAYSVDGETWMVTTTGGYSLCDLVCVNNRIVGVGYSGVSAYSTDGTSWTAMSGLDTSYSYRGVTYGNNRFVCVGGGSYGVSYYSTNGETWTVMNYYSDAKFNSVAYGNNRFVTVGQSTTTPRSSSSCYLINNTSWAAMTGLDLNVSYQGVTYGNNRFVCVGANGKSYYSTDGTSWTAMSGLDTSYSYRGVTYGKDRFICVGFYGVSAYSTDGETWTAMSGLDSKGYYNSVTYGKDRFICVGQSGKSAYSVDGETWTAMSGLDSKGYYESVTSGISGYTTYLTYTIPAGYHSAQKIMLKTS